MSPPEVRGETLKPLCEITERQEAMARCVGPITTMATLTAMDQAFPDGMAGESYRVPPATFESGFIQEVPPVLSDLRITHSQIFNDLHLQKINRDLELTPDQACLFERFTFYGGDFYSSVEDSLYVEMYVTGRLALPAYIAARDELADMREVKDRTEEVRIANDAPAIIRSPDFQAVLRSLSFSANGAYRGLNTNYDNYFFQRLQTDFEELEDENGEASSPIALYDICQKKQDGTIGLNPVVTKILRLFMKHDNSHGIHNEKTSKPRKVHGSIGCPVSLKQTSVREDDFTAAQWWMFLSGDNPIATFDRELGSFTLLRNPINEYADLLASGLEKLRDDN